MSKSNTMSVEKIMLPLRLAPEVYEKLREKVYRDKTDLRGYSMNQYITDLIEQDLKSEN